MMERETGITDWLITAVPALNSGDLLQSWISSPLATTDGTLVFAGCIKASGPVHLRVLNGTQVVGEIDPNPGFLIGVPRLPGMYLIEVEGPQTGRCVWQIDNKTRSESAPCGVSKQPQSDPGVVGTGAPYALAGKMGHLFLAGDSNDSVGQFIESRSLSERSTAGWTETFRRFSQWKSQFGLAKLSVLIAPSKEEILQDYYPFIRAKRTIIDDFMNRFQNEGIIWPRWELWNRRYLAWSCTDTHWTDYGATTAAKAVLTDWNISDSGLPEIWRVRQRIGDLGNKVQPPVASYELTFPSDLPARLIFENGVANQGNIRLYRNPQAVQPGRLLVFGDSFGTNLCQAFSGVFSEVAYAYQPAGFDPELVGAVRPDHVLLQITQRFLHGQPATGASVFVKAREKIALLPEIDRSRLLARLAAEPAEFSAMTTPLLTS